MFYHFSYGYLNLLEYRYIVILCWVLKQYYYNQDVSFIYFLSSKNHYCLVLAFLSDCYLLIVHINSKDAIKCMLNVNQDNKLMRRPGRLYYCWLKVFFSFKIHLQIFTNYDILSMQRHNNNVVYNVTFVSSFDKIIIRNKIY